MGVLHTPDVHATSCKSMGTWITWDIEMQESDSCTAQCMPVCTTVHHYLVQFMVALVMTGIAGGLDLEMYP